MRSTTTTLTFVALCSILSLRTAVADEFIVNDGFLNLLHVLDTDDPEFHDAIQLGDGNWHSHAPSDISGRMFAFYSGSAPGVKIVRQREADGENESAIPGHLDYHYLAFDREGGRLWVTDFLTYDLYRIDLQTGEATLVAEMPLVVVCLVYDPLTDLLYFFSPPYLYSADPDTGAVLPVGNTNSVNVGPLAFNPADGQLYYMRKDTGWGQATLHRISRADASTVQVGGPYVLFPSGLAFATGKDAQAPAPVPAAGTSAVLVLATAALAAPWALRYRRRRRSMPGGCTRTRAACR